MISLNLVKNKVPIQIDYQLCAQEKKVFLNYEQLYMKPNVSTKEKIVHKKVL